MAAQVPAVVIVARHGTRFDAAHATWHLSTPTPYDPPLTYAGWNHCRALGLRIGSLLHSREQSFNNAAIQEEAAGLGNGQRRKRKKHRIVIHTSPFLRCVQTSVGIAAGMAQFEPAREIHTRSGPSKARLPSHLYSASPRLRGADNPTSPSLTPIAEPKHDIAHSFAQRAYPERLHHRKARIRVDPFLGEWLNPSYFEDITPPPPSAMMVTTAKAELMHNETIDVFQPTISNKSSNNSLWTAAHNRAFSLNREVSIDDSVDESMDSLAVPMSKRDRASSSSMSSESTSGPRSPFRAGHVLHPFISTIPKPEPAVYHPPVPAYALAGNDHIPKGYVSHARNECVDVDIHWDSSREPLGWGDGGEYGEEWSSMQRRFRRGLNNMVEWYSKHDSLEDPFEDEEQAHKKNAHLDDDVEEDLVVVLVTHAAGCNALIGALTSQPVLLDVGMASLTMAVKKQDAPPLLSSSPRTSPDPLSHSLRRHSLVSMDIGLSSIYEMKMVSSSEHLRPGGVSAARTPDTSSPRESLSRPTRGGTGFDSISAISDLSIPSRNSTSTSLGSIRRPSLGNIGSVSSAPDTRGASPAFTSRLPAGQTSELFTLPSPGISSGLWTPPTNRLTPQLAAQPVQDERNTIFSQLNDALPTTPGRDIVLHFSPPAVQPPSEGNWAKGDSMQALPCPNSGDPCEKEVQKHDSLLDATSSAAVPESTAAQSEPASRGSSPAAGLWGTSRAMDMVAREAFGETKRRWTLMQPQQLPPSP